MFVVNILSISLILKPSKKSNEALKFIKFKLWRLTNLGHWDKPSKIISKTQIEQRKLWNSSDLSSGALKAQINYLQASNILFPPFCLFWFLVKYTNLWPRYNFYRFQDGGCVCCFLQELDWFFRFYILCIFKFWWG